MYDRKIMCNGALIVCLNSLAIANQNRISAHEYYFVFMLSTQAIYFFI